MELYCKSCGTQIDPAEINIQLGMAKCTHCGQVFRIEDLLPPGTDAVGGETPVTKPHHTKLHLDVMPDREFVAEIPPAGYNYPTLFLLIFAMFWLGITAVWTGGALLALLVGKEEGSRLFSFFMALLSIPFWAVGFAVLVAGLWELCGRTLVRVNRYDFEIRKSLFGFSRIKKLETEKVDSVEMGLVSQAPVARPMQVTDYNWANMPSIMTVCTVVSGTKRFGFGSRLDISEKKWLVYEIGRFVARAWPR